MASTMAHLSPATSLHQSRLSYWLYFNLLVYFVRKYHRLVSDTEKSYGNTKWQKYFTDAASMLLCPVLLLLLPLHPSTDSTISPLLVLLIHNLANIFIPIFLTTSSTSWIHLFLSLSLKLLTTGLHSRRFLMHPRCVSHPGHPFTRYKPYYISSVH